MANFKISIQKKGIFGSSVRGCLEFMSISWTKATLTHYVLLGYECKDVKCIEEKVSGKERKNIWKAVYFRQADVICPRERSLVFTKYI